jgi:NADP-dependent 3-hydroxy acid dehydrogenase YdfG
LAQWGPEPLYLSADARDIDALQTAYGQIKQRFGAIHGVVHATIVLQDQSLARMEEETFKASLSAKVDTAVNMAQVFGGEALDFMLFFSSLQSFTMAPGQSNYAAGCTFTDALAQALQRSTPETPIKVLNWGYWGSVGIVASEDYRHRMERGGVASIDVPEGMAAVERLLTGPMPQMGFIKTTQSKVAASKSEILQ